MITIECKCVKPDLIIRHVLDNVNTNMINSKRVSLLKIDLRMLNYTGNYLMSVRVLKSNISLSVYEQYFKSVNNPADSFFLYQMKMLFAL